MGTKLRIILVNNTDTGSGAGRVAWDLLRGYTARGYEAWYLVDLKKTGSPDVLVMKDRTSWPAWGAVLSALGDRVAPFVGRVRGAGWLRTQLRRIAEPRRLLDYYKGFEEFDFPATWDLLDYRPEHPDIVHCHDLIGGYFDLGAVPWLSHEVPLVLTLHNSWTMTGHCSHSFDCDRWMTGCGMCPDLRSYPPLRRDRTADNWLRKQSIYEASRLYLATPCEWLMHKVEGSILRPAIAGQRVIPHGVDVATFRPEDMRTARESLGISPSAVVLLLVAAGGKHNLWKDFDTLSTGLRLAASRLSGREIQLLVVGGTGLETTGDHWAVRFRPYEAEPRLLTQYYNAADIYVHCTLADTFPNVILEALACGKPVIATAVGGIPEQVRNLDASCATGSSKAHRLDEATGVLVPPADAEALARCIQYLVENDNVRRHLGQNAARDARIRFNLSRQVDDYLSWYEEIIADWTRAQKLSSVM